MRTTKYPRMPTKSTMLGRKKAPADPVVWDPVDFDYKFSFSWVDLTLPGSEVGCNQNSSYR